ncbi:TlpA family protein disulfide reductase [Flavihumibacter stibioxidans]|nr:TlpA disulfide reductase family protein [Flavihumibacter stibioxidans]
MKTFILGMLSVVFFATANAQPKIGSQAPEIVLKDKEGRLKTLSSLKGKVVLVDFWASWCVPCRKSNRQMVPLYRKYQSKGFEIYGISLDEDPADWQKAVATDRIKWWQVNEAGWNAPNALAWGIEQLPTSFLLDKDGRIISIDPTQVELEKYLQQALQ